MQHVTQTWTTVEVGYAWFELDSMVITAGQLLAQFWSCSCNIHRNYLHDCNCESCFLFSSSSVFLILSYSYTTVKHTEKATTTKQKYTRLIKWSNLKLHLLGNLFFSSTNISILWKIESLQKGRQFCHGRADFAIASVYYLSFSLWHWDRLCVYSCVCVCLSLCVCTCICGCMRVCVCAHESLHEPVCLLIWCLSL